MQQFDALSGITLHHDAYYLCVSQVLVAHHTAMHLLRGPILVSKGKNLIQAVKLIQF